LEFIGIANLNDVPIGEVIGEFEDVGPRGQNLPGDFHRIVEGSDVFLSP
jgi:hypothetical protein